MGGKLAALYLKDASSRVRVFSRAGKPEREIRLPGLGTVTGLHGRHQARELFFAFTSFLTPTAVVRHDLGKGPSTVWQKLASPIGADQAGHGAGKPLAKSIEQYADEMAFLFGQFEINTP